MNAQPTLPLGPSPSAELRPRKWINERISIGVEGNLEVVFAAGIPLAQYHQDDSVGKRHAMAVLTETGLARVNEVASAFSAHRATVFRYRQKYEQGGVSALVSGKRGPKGPHKLGAERTRQLLKLKGQGLTNTQIAQRLGVTEGAIRRRLKQLNWSSAEPQQVSLETGDVSVSRDSRGEVETPPNVSPPTEPARAAEAMPSEPLPSGDTDPSDRSVDRLMARLGLLDDAAPLFATGVAVQAAGVLLTIPALVSSGVFDVARRVYGSLGPAFYGLRNTILVLLLMGLVRIRRAEGLKQRAPGQLGAVLGLDRTPEVKTLRRKLTELAARGQAHEFAKQLAELRLAQHEEALGFLYVDGHVRPYYGKRQLAKGFVSRRRLAMPATTDYWVNDTRGEPVLVVTAPANDALSRMLEPVLDEVQPLLGERRATVVFDRGGWSPKLFRRVIERGLDILTYRKFKRRGLPQHRFSEHRLQIEGQELTYQLAEQAVRLDHGQLRLRQIVRRTEDGHQTVMVTSRWDLPAGELAYRMFERWRQENYFKYMREEYELDGLVDYHVEPDDPQREVPHPRRKKLEQRLRQVRQQVSQLEQQYGVLAAEQAEGPSRVRGFKRLQAQLGKALRQAREKLRRLREQQQRLPKRARLGEVRERAQTMRLSVERKHLTDTFKMVAYQAETALYNQLAPHYSRYAQDGRKLLTEAFSTAGCLLEENGKLVVQLNSLGSPHRTQALKALCAELNQVSVRFPGSRLLLEYRAVSA